MFGPGVVILVVEWPCLDWGGHSSRGVAMFSGHP